MARAPKMPTGGAAAGADTGDDTGADAGADTGDDTGGDAGGDTGGDDGDQSDTVLVTIASAPDGGYVVYQGDEPDGGDGESADDDAAAGGGAGGNGAAGGGAMGGAGGGMGGAGAGGQHVDSIGAALKAALDILQEAASSAGAPGSADDQFAAGFGENQAPTPASARPGRGGLKYPPAAAA